MRPIKLIFGLLITTQLLLFMIGSFGNVDKTPTEMQGIALMMQSFGMMVGTGIIAIFVMLAYKNND